MKNPAQVANKLEMRIQNPRGQSATKPSTSALNELRAEYTISLPLLHTTFWKIAINTRCLVCHGHRKDILHAECGRNLGNGWRRGRTITLRGCTHNDHYRLKALKNCNYNYNNPKPPKATYILHLNTIIWEP